MTLSSLDKNARPPLLSSKNKSTILKKAHLSLETLFNNIASINIYTFHPQTKEVDITYPINCWPLPEKERQWVIHHHTNHTKHHNKLLYSHLNSRTTTDFIDKNQLKKDQKRHNYHCNDGLFFPIFADTGNLLGCIFINNWKNQRPIPDTINLDKISPTLLLLFKDISISLSKITVQTKLHTLLSEKQQMQQQLQQDEEDLMCRISEISALYDASNALGYTLNYRQIISIITEALIKVINFDICSIFLINGIGQNSEIFSLVNTPLSPSLVKKVQTNLLDAATTFSNEPLKSKNVSVTLKNRFPKTKQTIKKSIKSFGNVPLIFKEEVIGLLNICSTEKNAFPKNKMTFIHIMANQLASNIGRLKIIKQLEKSKITSLIESMDDSVFMLDESHTINVINPSARTLLNISTNALNNKDDIEKAFKKLKLDSFYNTVITEKKPLLNLKVSLNNQDFSLNISPVMNTEAGYLGTVFVFRDITEFQKIDRIKTQRLEVISQVNEIINSISDLNKLTSMLMKFILNVANAEMGSIQIKKGTQFLTLVHSNFPDKIRMLYTFKKGPTISEHVIKAQQTTYIQNYANNPQVTPNAKITLDAYICIPILVNKDLIGIVNIAKKQSTPTISLSQEDLLTLNTITALSGTAIQNAQRYHETIEKQRLDQELKVCNEIQKKLLPDTVPQVPSIGFGALSIPAREIGGDYYNFFEFKNGNIGIVIADIVGKGLPAGLFMAMLKSLLYTHVFNTESPEKALNQMNKALYNSHIISKFIPLLYGIINPKTLTFDYCNAGHEHPLYLTNNQFHFLASSGPPLGAIEDTRYTNTSISLNKNDIIVFFTDGCIESRNKQYNIFGIHRLKQTIKQNAHKTANKISNELFSKIQAFSSQEHQHDDITIVTMKIKSMPSIDYTISPIASYKTTLKSTKSNIKAIRHTLDQLCDGLPLSSEERYNIKLAVNESHANIIEHSYLGNETKDITFKFILFQNRLSIHIIDFGTGFKQKTTKGDKEHINELEGSGLGVFLINSLMDDVQYKHHDNHTEQILTKCFITPIKVNTFKGGALWK